MGVANSKQEAFWEACGFGHTPKVKKFLEEGIDVNWVSFTHNSCAIHVASQGKKEIVKLLIDAKCDVNVKDDRECLPIHHAAMKGFAEIITTLLDSGSLLNPIDKNGWSPLIMASYWCQPSAVEELLRKGCDIHIKNKDERTALHECARSPSSEQEDLGKIAAMLVEAGCDINAKSSDLGEADFTPLMFACYHGHLAVARELVKGGCLINAQGTNGWTALHWASDRDHADVVEFLLESGIDATLKERRGEQAIDRAKSDRVRKLFPVIPSPEKESPEKESSDDDEKESDTTETKATDSSEDKKPSTTETTPEAVQYVNQDNKEEDRTSSKDEDAENSVSLNKSDKSEVGSEGIVCSEDNKVNEKESEGSDQSVNGEDGANKALESSGQSDKDVVEEEANKEGAVAKGEVNPTDDGAEATISESDGESPERQPQNLDAKSNNEEVENDSDSTSAKSEQESDKRECGSEAEQEGVETLTETGENEHSDASVGASGAEVVKDTKNVSKLDTEVKSNGNQAEESKDDIDDFLAGIENVNLTQYLIKRSNSKSSSMAAGDSPTDEKAA